MYNSCHTFLKCKSMLSNGTATCFQYSRRHLEKQSNYSHWQRFTEFCKCPKVIGSVVSVSIGELSADRCLRNFYLRKTNKSPKSEASRAYMLRFKIIKFPTETIRSIFPIFCFLASKISCEQNTSWRFKFQYDSPI